MPRVDARRISRLVAGLDSDDDRQRERAATELKALGKAARPALRKALDSPSAEVKVVARGLLKALEVPEDRPPSPGLIALRVLEVLEKAGTPEASKLVAEVLRGAVEDRVAKTARAVLRRLGKRPGSR
jgi:hypothetical protein